jgi:hypothetical protein
VQPAIVEKLAHGGVLAHHVADGLGRRIDHRRQAQGVMGRALAVVDGLPGQARRSRPPGGTARAAVASDGTMTGAARQLNLSQSALSTQLRTLEASLGQDLFERRGRGHVLTEAGRIALDHAEAIFRTVDDLTATLR